MSEGGTKFKFNFLEKFKKIKHIEIYILIAFICIIGLIFFSTKSQSVQIEDNTTITGYIANMESRLENILSKIDGVSDVSVMISLDTNDIMVEGNKTKTDTFPSIKGIIITAKGVGDTKAKMKVLQAVETAFDINKNNIQIFSSD